MPGPFHFSQSTRLSISQPCENNSLMHGTCHSVTHMHTKITLWLLYADRFCFHFKKKWRGGLSTYWPTSNEKQPKMQKQPNKKRSWTFAPTVIHLCLSKNWQHELCSTMAQWINSGSMSYIPQWLNEMNSVTACVTYVFNSACKRHCSSAWPK